MWPFNRQDPSPFMPEPQTPNDPEPPAPSYVKAEDFQQAMQQVQGMNSKLDQMAGLFSGLLGGGMAPTMPGAPPTSTPQEPPIEDISDDEYAQALLQGDAGKISKRTNAQIERARRGIQQQFDQRFSALEQQGMAVLGQVQSEVGQSALSSLPYYQLFRSDIDSALRQLPVHQRTPEMRAHIYHATVGANLDKVRAHDAAEATRITREREALDPPGRGSRGDPGPTPESTFGDKLLAPGATWMGGGPLWGKRTPDGWAQNYYKVQNMGEAAVYMDNVMKLGNCDRCFGPIIGGKCHCRGNR